MVNTTSVKKQKKYILADDGRLYPCSAVGGSVPAATWVIRFDDEGHIKLTVRRLIGVSEAAAVDAVREDMVRKGLRVLIAYQMATQHGSETEYWIDVCKPVPAGLFTMTGVWQPPGVDCLIYSFGYTWG